MQLHQRRVAIRRGGLYTDVEMEMAFVRHVGTTVPGVAGKSPSFCRLSI